MYKNGFDFQVGYVTVKDDGTMIPREDAVRRVLPDAYVDAQKKVKEARKKLKLAQERLADIHELKIMLDVE